MRRRDGVLAPTLGELIEEGRFTACHEAALSSFCSSLIATPVIFTDLNSENVVYGSTRHSGERFVLIDGLGFKNLIPTERMSRAVNKWRNERSVERLRANVASRAGQRSGQRYMLPTAV